MPPLAAEIWRTPRTDGTNWAAPLVVRHDGRKQIVVNSPRKVRGYDYESGTQIWETTGLGLNTIPRAVQHGDSVVVMSGFINPRAMAIRLGRQGDLAGTDAIKWGLRLADWHTRRHLCCSTASSTS